VDRKQNLTVSRADPEDGQIVVQDRRRGVAPDVDHLADVLAPQLLAIKAVAEQAGRAVTDKDALPVRDRRSGAEGIGVVRRLFFLVFDLCLPDFLAVGAVEAEQGTVCAALRRLGQEDTVTPDDGSGIALVGQPYLPADVLGGTPVKRQVLLGAV